MQGGSVKSKYATVAVSVVAVFLLLLASAVMVCAQDNPATPAVLTHPQVNSAIHFDVSRPLRDMATEGPSQASAHQASPVRYPKLQQLQAAQQGQQREDGALQTTGGPLVSATIGLNLLGVGNGFPGYTVPDAPPDVNLAVGDTQVVQWV